MNYNVLVLYQAEKNSTRVRSMKRALEEMEEDNSRLTTARRRIQREVDDLNEQIENLQRELRNKS